MKLNELKNILRSNRGRIQMAILYDSKADADMDNGSIDYIVSTYGYLEVIRIEACKDQLIITV